jgi:hypothetical protein
VFVPEAITRPCLLIVDTNILLMLPRIDAVDWQALDSNINAEVTVCILESVMDELYGLARDQLNTSKATAAQQAYTYLLNLQQRAVAGKIPLLSGGHLQFAGVPAAIHSPLDPANVDHQQIAFAQEQIRRVPKLFCAIVTRDQEMADIAAASRPRVFIIAPGGGNIAEAIRQRLHRLLLWDSLPQAGEQAGMPAPSVKPKRLRSKHPRDAHSRLQQVVRNLYSRIRAARHRAILTIAPLEMRLALTAHLATLLTTDRQRVLLLFVANERTALWWGEELRRRCQLPTGSILVFGTESITRLAQARLVIYRYDQIERRLHQHATRFQKAGRRITAVVDSCDLLDPVAIAMLLLRCDQFIGFTQHPPGHTQAVGGRMLDAFFQEESIAAYTFADAEQDGWLHPFDLLRRPVYLAEDELEEFDKTNDEFLRLHSAICKRHPELQRATDFWQTLLHFLGRTVDDKAANLFVLRERREALAQMTRAKLAMVSRLLEEGGDSARCLIFDYEQLWSNVLLGYLSEQGYAVAVVERLSDFSQWEVIWRRFENCKLDCVILQDVPPAGLVPAGIKRLILLTPITPLAVLSAMTDWTLAHTASGQVVSVDIIYSVATPEEEAMMDFADSCCGVRFEP